MRPAPQALPQTAELQAAPRSASGKAMFLKIGVIVAILALGKVGAMARRGPVGTAEMRLMGIVIGEVMLFVMAIWDVEFVFSILLLYLPFSHRFPGDYGWAVNIANILIAICIFGLFLRSVKEGGHFFVKTELDRWIGIWFLLLFISFFRASIQETRNWLMLVTLVKRFCTPIFMYYLTSWIIRDRPGINNSMFVMLVSTLMVAVLATKDTVTPTHFDWERRESGVVDQANILAAFLVYYMFYFFSFFWLNRSRIKYWLLLLCLYPCVRGILISFSRGGYVALIAASLFVSFVAKRALFLAVAVALLVVWAKPGAFLPGAVVERLKGTVIEERSVYSTGTSKELEASAQSRLDIWKGGLKMIFTNPILGVGYGQFPYLIGSYQPSKAGKDPHNGYILIAAEMGLPALAVFMLITVKLLRYSLVLFKMYMSGDRLYAAIGLGYSAGVVGLWAANMFGSRFNTTETISFFWVIAALIMLIRRLQPSAGQVAAMGGGAFLTQP